MNDKEIQMKIDIADHTIKMCLEFPPKNNVRQCNISLSAAWEWFDYTASVAFTTGIILELFFMSRYSLIRHNSHNFCCPNFLFQ